MSGMTKEAIDRILELNPLEQFQVDARQYYALSGEVHALKPPTQTAVGVATLTAISDYFRENPDNLELAELIVHVVDPRTVKVMSPITAGWLDRHHCIAAECKPKSYPFGQPQAVENFIVALQTYFVASETTAALQGLVSSIQDEASIKYEDDGIGQTVTAKTGIARVGVVTVPNPVKLAPYRTFSEISQPESSFVFRLKKGGDGPLCTLYEADGGDWQLDAVKKIRDWLRMNLPEGTTILA